MYNKLFTSESVTEGHPDKICDAVSDAVLDEILSKDPNARVACECCVTTGLVFVMGEITTNCYADIAAVARKTVAEIGYTNAKYGFDAETCGVTVSIKEQSPDIAMGVDTGGAGDQGMMFGYACDETPELMPLAIMLAHRLSSGLTALRKDNVLRYLRPDGKTQVTVEYENGKPKRVDTVVVSTQHDPGVSLQTIRKDIIEKLINEIIDKNMMDKNTKIFVNPTGRFEVGGPQGDSGLTGRKIIVDTYGGYAPHGGGAFSGKDPTKVDRSAAYMCRYICKNIVAAGLASKAEIEIAYAIGVREPVSVFVNTYGTGKISDEKIADIIKKEFDLTPNGIIEMLKLRSPIYRATASGGHFGREEFAWEKTDKAEELKKYCK